jgi:hypothetical protein
MDEDDNAAAPSVEQAIQLDARLDAAQKEALMRIYRSFVGKGCLRVRERRDRRAIGCG